MEQEYQPFCLADPSFYDAMHSEDTAGESFPTARRPLPDGWRLREQDDWLVVDPPDGHQIPLQGWKIHASATTGNASVVLDAVWEYCVPRGIEFKFLRSPSALTARVAKYAPRGYSGKLVTIYPADDTACETILRELGGRLDGQESPYILSDLRWGKGPLYVRYGAFANRYTVNDSGEVVEAIADPDGNLVADRRDPVFHVPSWVTLPDFLAPHLAARNATTVGELPYSIERVLHFSNGGGIYVGKDQRTGEDVVLKEGRPHAGLDAWGHDAVRRLEREYETLTRLAGIPGIPRVHDLFWLGEHRFLVMDYVDGDVLGKALVTRYPLIDPAAGPARFAEFTDWATDIHRQVEETIAAVHERGIVYGDLHLFNVMVRPDGTAALVDFEVAAPVDESTRPGLGNPGFAAPRSATGFDIDRYALACLRLALFLPMTNLLGLHRVKARHFAEIIATHFPVEPDFLARAVDVIVPSNTPSTPSPKTEPDSDGWPALRNELADAIVASATPLREDRLFPGDPQQFAVGGLGLAYGAAGVLHALSVTGAGRYPELEDWLVRHATNPPTGSRLGLYDGLHGVAFALEHLGRRQEALDVVDICLRENWTTLGSDLVGGLPGMGLNLLHLADRTGEPALREAAHRAAERVADRLSPDMPDDVPDYEFQSDSSAEISGGGSPLAGLLRGRAGSALLLLRLYDDTGDTAYLERARVALRQDLRCCVLRDNGVLEVNEGWRTMPYLDGGSIGIGMVLDEYLRRCPDEHFALANRGVEMAARSTMYILPGLFTGRAGVVLYLAGRSPSPVTDPLVAKQVRALAWHALPYGGGMAFPGTALLRLSMDLATGTAGVLLAMGAALHDQPVRAPLLTLARDPAPKTPTATVVGLERQF
ncbi:protein kinase-like protein [Herbihabitans rhizosphaerae]|uniref:non-specific serine/threonine protein kinase n=1 Tax=Herbihabitans rhizosphaerae TaxID=1872711 RepID=A0A4Q7KPX1_9PSEU|nr:class III lanthionine synthetase LanKC [Herbihabitans rhizosphaerae]RZS38839.1 protein kinase-like protein [Herbihabitans rhizosphaerae]